MDVFRKSGKLYIVMEYVGRTVLEEIEATNKGLSDVIVKSFSYQLLWALKYMHSSNIMHRDIKPENLLVSKDKILKVCDFGFARTLAGSGAKYTDYVSTRWYRAPELLVGDVQYGFPVDIWAVGCMFAEMATSVPLFAGDNDLDQLHKILECITTVPARYRDIFRKNPLFSGLRFPEAKRVVPLQVRFKGADSKWLDFLSICLHGTPDHRPTASELLEHPYFEDFAPIFQRDYGHLYEKLPAQRVTATTPKKKGGKKTSRSHKDQASTSRTYGERRDHMGNRKMEAHIGGGYPPEAPTSSRALHPPGGGGPSSQFAGPGGHHLPALRQTIPPSHGMPSHPPSQYVPMGMGIKPGIRLGLAGSSVHGNPYGNPNMQQGPNPNGSLNIGPTFGRAGHPADRSMDGHGGPNLPPIAKKIGGGHFGGGPGGGSNPSHKNSKGLSIVGSNSLSHGRDRR